jgi:hypothetical protein
MARIAGNEPERTLFSGYTGLAGCYDEIVASDGQFRRDVRRFARLLDGLGARELDRRQRLAEGAFRQGGITFSVSSDRRGVEKIFPFDLIPRVVTAREWAKIERGLVQRVRALNLFLADVYGARRILRDVLRGSSAAPLPRDVRRARGGDRNRQPRGDPRGPAASRLDAGQRVGEAAPGDGGRSPPRHPDLE